MKRSAGVRWVGAAMLLALVGCASAKPAPRASVVGLWAAQEIAGVPLVPDSRITLSLYGDGKAVGRAGCNNYSSTYKRAGDALSFGPVISTKMACAPEIMSQEQAYLDILGAAPRYERLPDGTLVLTAEDGKRVLFRRDEPASLQDARARGVDFRAVGQEPGWVVEVKDGDHITAVLDYGASTLLLPTPAAETADGVVTYDATTDTDHLVLKVTDKICIDSMSGETHPATVELVVNDKAYQGCGSWLD
jgi:heat shock protein HslJ